MGASVQTHYDTLSVAREAAPELVRTAYRRQAQRFHPDKTPGHEAQLRMAQINEAYAVLSNPARRATYDRWIQARHARMAAERQVARAAQPLSRFSAAWPWTLLFATIACAVLAVGTVLYKSAVRQVAPPLNTTAAMSAPVERGSTR